MNGTLLSYETTYIHLIGISKERRGAKNYLKKYGKKYSKFDLGGGGAPRSKKFKISKHKKKSKIK